MSQSRHAADAVQVKSRSIWIINPSRDLILFVATPLLILPAFFTAMRQWSAEEIALFVFAFGQLGHNLPGMMRAYGDRALFEQHKIRFIIAPLALLAISVLFIVNDLKGLILVAAMWGIWHALMQTYGLLRIYDAKTKSFAKLTQRLDLAMCVSWFGLAVLLSPGRLMLLLDLFFKSGGSTRVAPVFGPLTLFWISATLVITACFIVNLVRSWLGGCPPNPIKLLLMLTSFGFYWYTSVTISNVLLGLAMFEVFHDVQYLAIVWIFNRNRVENGSRVGSFTRFLFRRSGALIGVYLGLIFAYGSLYIVEDRIARGGMKDILTALLATSGLLHFYYDGFIWKLREKSTRKSLQITAKGIEPVATSIPQWTVHALKWTAFALPTCWLLVAELGGGAPELERLEALRVAVPTNPSVHLQLGDQYQMRGDAEVAMVAYHAAIQLDSESTNGFNNLGLLLVNRGKIKSGIACYQRALEIDPSKPDTYNNLANAYAELGEFARAEACFAQALAIDPEYLVAHNNLALTLAQAGRFDEAEQRFRDAIRLAPKDPATRYNLGNVLAYQKKYLEAASQFREVVKLEPEHARANAKLSQLRQREK
jgi:tetratricopeptide (TPR) repeat protein